MTSYIQLKRKDLQLSFDNLPMFSTTMEILPYENIIGQKQAIKSINIGLAMDKKGYNIFVSGESGTGKTSYIIKKVEEYAKDLPAPRDWCYVYNFEEEIKPLAIPLLTETATEFKKEFEEFIASIFKESPTLFNDKSYEQRKANIIEKYEKLSIHFSKELYDTAVPLHFRVETNPEENFVFIPLIDGKDMDSEVYNKLSESEKDILNEGLNKLKLVSYEVLNKMQASSKEFDTELKALEDAVTASLIDNKINMLKNKYGPNDKVDHFLNLLRLDLLENIYMFLNYMDEDEDKQINKIPDKNFFKRYEVNVLVTNRKGKGAPVILEASPEYNNIFGKIEYKNDLGSIVTDFTMIRSGSLHLANGGFLIMDAKQFFSNPISWKVLKRCLKSDSIIVENAKSNLELYPIINLSPEDIPLQVKIILIGTNMSYSILNNDDDFNELFRIKAEFDHQIENEKENLQKILGFLAHYITENSLLHITRNGVIEILRYATRLAENRAYLTASMNKVLEIIDLASVLARKQGINLIDESHILDSIEEFQNMHNLYKKKILEMYKNRIYIVDLKGTRVGQINGLSVIDTGDCTVGQQHKITVATYAGKKGIINIEREANMSGSIHSKGILILSGFVGELLGQTIPLSFNASIVFEQLYSGIEGDSASGAELIALLSSLSDFKIKQSLAITGSINQKGEIQPIGGVNEKIEGFFDICNLYGLDGTHGVIIPYSNVNDLILNIKILDAIDNNLFHIYAVKTLEDCIDILYDFDFHKNVSTSIMDTIKERIIAKLQKYNKIILEEK
ncbi:Lon protease family protein [Clostridium sp.]|uniref:Lon protease family protein n=1 Tax=Clostridium sp. TaxID=1506 RepID=UPI001A4BFC54|nr:ATP-binding protein [Clostridium sp.]MBK5240357.1 AAA family ATPase [Clostridium sp.]